MYFPCCVTSAKQLIMANLYEGYYCHHRTFFQSRTNMYWSYMWLTACRDITKILTSILFLLSQHRMSCKYWDSGIAILNIHLHERVRINLSWNCHIYVCTYILHAKRLKTTLWPAFFLRHFCCRMKECLTC